MSVEESHNGISPAQMKRAWFFVTWAGFLGGSYFLINIQGAPRIKFLTELGATAFDFGLIQLLVSIALVFQILGSLLGNRVRHRKAVWMTIAIIHRLSFVAVALAPMFIAEPRWRMAWILFVLFFHDALAQTATPIWFSWMADLVPKESINRYWATRQRTINAATIIVMVAIAVGFSYFEIAGRVKLGFALLSLIGVGLGVMDILMFLWVPDIPHERVENTGWFETVLQPIKDAKFRPFLAFMGYWHFAVFAAQPFFGLYMIDRLGLTVMAVQLLATAGALGATLTSGYWGLVCDRYGYRPTLQFLSQAKALTPLAFLFMPVASPTVSTVLLSIVLFLDGVWNAGMALGLQGVLLRDTPRRNRTMYMAAANFIAIGIMASLSPLVAGYFISWLKSDLVLSGLTINSYQIVFFGSVALHALAFPLAARIYEPGAAPLLTMARQAFSREAFRVPRLLSKFHESSQSSQRIGAIEGLGVLRSPMAIGDLIGALRDPDHGVREAAAEALGKIGASEAAEALGNALFDPSSGVQSPAARALGRIGGADSLKPLLKGLSNQGPVVLGEVIDALVRIGDDVAVLPLVCLFNEVQDESTRVRIAWALAQLNQLETADEVMPLLIARTPQGQQFSGRVGRVSS